MTTKTRVRLSLEVSPEVKDRVERLQEKSKATSITEVIRRALAVYETVLEARADGSKLVIERKGGGREVIRVLE